MKNYIKKSILSQLAKRGFQRNTGNEEDNSRKDALYDVMKEAFRPENQEIVSIMFSKDRAMQLDGFLASYFENVANYSPVKVLYHTSSQEHEQSYRDLRELYKDKPVEFIKENSFRKQLIETLENSSAGRVFFYVDDMLVTQKIDYNWFKEVDPLTDIVSLTRGKDLVYSTVLAKPLQVPQINHFRGSLHRFMWNEIKEFSDWSYPLGVSGYMFSRKEMLQMFKVLNFKAPNSLESSMQAFISYFINRGGICLDGVATPCVHTNLTQTEGYNNVLGHFSLEELLELWKENKRINYHEFMRLPVSEAEVKKYSFVERKNND